MRVALPEPGAAVRKSGMEPHSVFGHLPHYMCDPLGFYSACAAQSDWTPLRFGFRRAFLAVHPNLIEAVLVSNHRSFRKSAGVRRSAILFGEGLLTSEGDFWRHQRRLIQPAFHRDRIAGYAEDMVSITGQHLERWQREEPFDLHEALMGLTLEIAVQTLFGSRVVEVEAVAKAMSTGQNLFARWMHYLIMLPDWMPTPAAAGTAQAIKQLDRVVYGMIDSRRASGKMESDLLSTLLHLEGEDAEDGRRMSRKQIRDEVLTLFLAGHETTALALTWSLSLLAAHPEELRRLREEADPVLAGRSPGAEDLRRLSVSEQVIREAMRLYPPAWVVGREALEDVVIGGHSVPKRATVLMPQYVVHRDARFYPEPERFLPQRWTAEFQANLPAYAYFPFGGGPRVCIGNRFAMMEAVLLLALIATRFDVAPCPDRRVQVQPAFTLRPRTGFWVTVVERRQSAMQALAAGA